MIDVSDRRGARLEAQPDIEHDADAPDEVLPELGQQAIWQAPVPQAHAARGAADRLESEARATGAANDQKFATRAQHRKMPVQRRHMRFFAFNG